MEPSHAKKFDALLDKVLSVPKKEIDRRIRSIKKQRGIEEKV